MLVRDPRFAIVAVLTLGIGIGAITSIFSIMDALILQPLPQRGRGQLVCFRSVGKQGQISPHVFSLTVAEIAKQEDLLSELCYFNVGWVMLWENEDFVEEARGARVSPNFTTFWNVAPLLGRGFLPDEGKPGQEPVVLLSHRFWQTNCGGRADIVGEAIRFDRGLFTVVGVMPPHFRFPEDDCDFWLPRVGFDHDLTRYGVAARLRPGVSRARVQAVLDTVLPSHFEAVPQRYRRSYGEAVDVAPLRSLFMGEAHDFLEKALVCVFGVIVFVLLIGCVNTANLLLSRTEARRREVAVRAALGAGRLRLARQFLTESSLLALFGGLTGVVLSWCLLHIMVSSIPWYVPRLRPIELNLPMLAFTLSVSLLVGLVVGSAPVLQACRGRLEQALREGVAGVGGSATGWFRSSLVVSEVAFAVALLVAAGLTVRSVVSMLHLDPGFEPAGLLRVSLRLRTSAQPDDWEMLARAGSIRECLAGVSRVESVGVRLPELGLSGVTAEGRTHPTRVLTRGISVESQDTLRTMGARLLSGRFLSRSDAYQGSPVILVNEKLAGSLWPGQNAVGKKVSARKRDRTVVFEVVGVVSNIRTRLWGLWGAEASATMYRPYRAMEWTDDWATFILSTRASPASLIPAVRHELKARGLARNRVTFSIIAQDLYDSTAVPRLFMSYVTGFATAGLVLAAIGIYGVISYSVARRTHEIGVRMALGAQRADVFKLVIKKGVILIVIGLVIGVAAALALSRVLASLLYGVTATDPMTFVAVSLLLTVVGLTACYIPARRATKIDPMVALRYE
ncbi:MAG: ABC transporter permease [Phycisphaerales bacterium]|nr:MAG: ABC transporter permease [Phycisphaerales bacterium]